MKKLLLTMTALLATVWVWAGVTDLPELSTAENPVYYVIHNTRSEGGLVYFNGTTIKDNNPIALEDKYLFYFTDAGDGKVKICNKTTNLRLQNETSWTEEGANCLIDVTPHSSKAGLFIQYGTGNQDYLNEQNGGRDGYTYWYADDAGSIFTIEKLEDVHMPAAGKTYNIANPIFIGNQGVVKGMTVADADATKATWKTVMYSTENDQWVYNTNSEGKMSLKNVATNKYLNGASLSDTEVFGDLKYLGCGQFNIVVNGATCHAAGHSSGAGSNGDIVHWGGGIGTASAWTFREATEKGYISVYSDFYAPIDITTDDANPKYFPIKSGRGDEKWYTYTSDDQKIALQAYTESDDQLWYFKGAVSDDGTVLVRLFPKSGEGKAMSYENTSDGEGKIVAKALDTNGWTNTWKLQKGSTATHCRLQTSDGANYLSHYNNGNAKMGMYSSSSTSDAGTQMYIYTPKTMYQELVDMVSTAEAKTARTDYGYYKPTEAYTTALNTAKSLTSTSTVLASFNALRNLRNASNSLEAILPEAGKFYRIAYDYGGETGRKYLQGKASTVKGVEYSSETSAASIFYYDGSKLLSFTAGEYLRENDNYRGLQGVGVEGGNVTFEVSPRTIGKLCIKLTSYLHANSGNGNLYSDHCSGNGCNQHDHIVEAVTWLPVPMNTEAGYATLYSPVALDYTYANEERVKAYTATAISEDNTSIEMTECANGIPANTPVILKYVDGGTVENGCVYLHVSNETITAPEKKNKLLGTFAAEYITDDAYVLSKPAEKETGLYKAMKNQSNNTAWKNNGFKAYLPANALNDGGGEAPSLAFNFGTETAIESIENAENVAGKAGIYDLSGRRVKSAQKGIFIINGKKVVK